MPENITSDNLLNKDIWPDPTSKMLLTPEFEAVWRCIKSWDIKVPEIYNGYMGATGNHVRAILDALKECSENKNFELSKALKE